MVEPEQEPEAETEAEPTQESGGSDDAESGIRQEAVSSPEATQDGALEIVPEDGAQEEIVSEETPKQESEDEVDDVSAVEPEALPEVEPGTEAQTDEPSPEPETAVSWPAASFAARTSGVNVTVTADEGAFPEGATMSVRRVWDADALSEIRESVADDFVKVRRVQLVDIAFYDAGGNEIEPRIPVSVVISVSEINDDQSAVVVHMDDEGQTQIVADTDVESASGRTNLNVELPAGDTEPGEVEIEQTEVGVGDVETEISFDADGFSLYAVVVTETISTHYIDASGNTYNVEVSYGPEAGIPSGATLSVSELTGDEAEAYAARAAEALNVNGSQVAYAKALDISILADGQPVQPQTPVSVSIKLLDAPEAAENTNIDVIHFGDEPKTLSCALEGDAVTFEADGFSVYVVTYTHQPENQIYSYTAQAGGSLMLSELLEELGIENGISEVETVTAVGSVQAEQENGDWRISTEGEPTEGDSSLTLMMNNNDTITINVTFREKVTVTITEHSETVDYDGQEHTVNGYEVSSNIDNYTEEFFTFSGTASASGTNAGSYDMALTAADFVNVNDSYDVTFVIADGGLTINPTSATVTADEKSKVYGDADPDFTATVEGLIGEDTVAYTLSRSEGEDVGDYAITPAGEAEQGNYNVTFVPANLLVTRATATVTAEAKTKTYGDADPELTATATGLKNDDTVSVITYTLSRAEGEDAGEYAITPTGDAEQGNYSVTFVPANLTVTKVMATVTADAKSKIYGTADPELTATVSGLKNDDAESVITYTLSRAEGESVGEYAITPTGEAQQGNYEVGFVPGTLEITRPTVTAVDSTYDGQVHALVASDNPDVLYFSLDGSEYALGAIPTAINAGTYTVNYRLDGEEAQSITATIKPAPVTLTANSATMPKTDEAITVSGYTCSVNGLTFDGVSASGSGTEPGMYDVTFEGVTLKETKDTTGNYVVTATQNGLLIIMDGEVSNLISKELTEFNGDLASYKIVFNPNALSLNNGGDITIKDTFSENQSINYGSVQIKSKSGVQTSEAQDPSFDYSGYTGTFTVPDGDTVTITYTTRVKGNVGDTVDITNTATLGRVTNQDYASGPSSTVNTQVTIAPTGSDISGTGGVYSIKLYVYAEGHMERGLEGAAFRLLDSNMRPMTYKAGANKGQPIVFTTGETGYVDIALDEAKDGLAIRKNTAYYLEMVTTPFEILDGNYIYYQKDNTYYSFLITDESSYEYGSIYSYSNGDVLKVRCYPEGKGVNVTKRFGGNYALTDAQKNAITFILQKENPSVEGGWEDVESHTYAEFSYGSINFSIGKEGGAELEDYATYHVIEENALPEELEGIVEENVSVSISYQKEGMPVQDDSNEFTVDPDDSKAFSYDLAFTNEYVDHKLTIIKIDGNTGKALPGAVFTVYDAQDNPVATYEAGNGNSITIRRGDAQAAYAADTLYYVAETRAPEDYITPASPEKIYFYFSEGKSGVPEGLPADVSATDLTTSYNTVTLPNRSEAVDIPVTATWGVKGDEAWPEEVKKVVVGLYKSVGGGTAEPVTKDGQPQTLELTKDQYYDTATFVGLPAQEGGKDIFYSVVEENVYGEADVDISDRFADSSSVSGTGWYVVNNQPAVSVVVNKAWLGLDGHPVTDASGKPEVTFDIYRTTTESKATGFTRDELVTFLAGAERVRTGLKLSADSWSKTVDSLQATDKEEHPYYYYALEQVPDNHEDSYAVAAATETAPRTLTISNRQTPYTVTIAVNDLEKIYGDETPDYTFTPDVKEDGATVVVSGPDSEGKYTATVTSANGAENTITFTVSREEGENAGAYTVTPSGDPLQSGYRVLYESGTLTINKALVIITAGAEKTYGDADPALVTIKGLKRDDDASVLSYTVSREDGEDVGEYPITLSGGTDQGNYTVTYVRRDADGKAYNFKINRATTTVKAKDSGKTYGEDDPDFEAEVTGLKFSDEATVLNYDLTREAGEDVGEYTITPSGEAEQGNYNVSYETGKFIISTAGLTIKAEDDEKTYGDVDLEWEVTFDGLTENDQGGTLTSALNEQTGARDYTYTVGEGEDAKTLLTFNVSRETGENVGDYILTPSGDATQRNYKIEYKTGTLTILRAELLVTPDRKVKAVGLAEDPLLTATVTGWMNGDEAAEATHEVGEGENAGVITWTYNRDGQTLLTFSLKRDAGEAEGDYPITATGGTEQSNYTVEYEEGVFEILAILDIDVTQPLVDHVDASANPTFTYKATLDLTGTGLTEYSKNGFEMVDGVPTQTFSLPAEDQASMKTLKVPGGAKLTVLQTDEHVYADYNTAIRLDSAPYTDADDPLRCVLDHVDTYHEIAFAHNRISLPVSARAAVGQTEEGATPLPGREGATGIPEAEDGIRAIDSGFADDMHSKIEYVLPADKYYAYDHASLYTAAGDAIAGGTNVTQIKYDRDNAKWLYRTNGDFVEVPENAQLVLFYLPKYVCKIGTEKFYSLRDAVEYADEHGKTATIEMLIGEYTIRSKDDAVTIPADCTITITTATTEYEGTGTAVISRSLSYPNGHLFYNDGTLTFDTITLEGNSVQAGDALVLNRAENAALTVNQGATLQNAKGVNGGAIYQAGGTVTVNGTLTNNAVTNGGGAVYVKAGTFTMGADGKLIGNSAATGGAVHVNDGTVNIGGTIGGTGEGDGNTATSGGAVYINKGMVNVTGSVTGNGADNGGAVYQVGGTLTVSGSMNQNTASVNGGAVYVSNGTLTVEAGGSLSDNSATSATGNGGAVYQAGGTVDNEGVISGNGAASGGGIYRVNGTLTVGGTLSGNTANENGGGLYTVGGAVTVTGTLGGDAEGAANSAANGGAIYTSGTTLNLNGARFTGNTATDNGGAIYALNADTVIGGTWTNAATEGTAASFKGNAATGNGGALYMEGGSVTVMNANSTLNANTAENGGAIYATSGAITVEKGKLESNEANANGGAIYVDSASVTVKGGTLGGTGKGNVAKQGNGGAIYSGSGPVTISGGTLAGNSAESGEGGAVYADSGTVNYTGGSINGGNSAVNGAAIFVGSGIANVSASITGNTATNGGAIGVGGTLARLNFKGNAEVNNNTMNGAQSNVYLDVDSELVVNADSLNNGKKIGIYVPGDVNSDQVVKHGDVTGYFGAYVSAGTLANISNVFKSDRFSDLKVAYENNRVYWIGNLTYDIYWLKNYDSQFPPTTSYTAAPSKKVCTNKTYAPRTRQSDIYDLVMAMKLYEKHNNDFVTNVGADYASTAVYAYTFSDKALNNTFENYLKTIRWDGTARKWVYDKKDGTTAPANTTKLVIFYSAPAYLTVVNNNTSGLELDISELTVLGKDAGEGVYGYVTAKNGATVTTLRTLTADDLKLGAGDSIKLMFPGAQGQKFTLKGTFTGEGAGEGTAVSYTFNGGARQTITGTTVDFSSDSFKLNPNDESADLIFGDALPICKIGDQPFSTLKAAIAYAVAQKASTGNDTYKIEMLVDYLVPKDDILEIPAGYNITFTTAAKDAETLPYKGNGTRATLSRDTGNTGSSVSATNSTLTVDSLAFDGRSLTASGAGGAVSATNCTTVTITNCDFKGYRAKNGGAVYVDNQKTGSSLTVEDCSFYNCQTNASNDKAGGGGLWTTARELYVRRCDFDFCACLAGNAQAGSIFHNIRSDWAPNSKTVISDCTFSNSYSVGGSGGTIETDALDVTIENCEFRGSYTNKSKGNGGAINALAGDAGASGTEGYIGNYNADCCLTVRNCLFEGCRADNSGNGGAIVSSMWYVTIENCKFDNCQSKYGGAIKMTNGNAKWLHINGSTFKNCTAADVGGGVHAAVPSIEIKKSNAGKFLDNTDNDGSTHFIDCVANRGGGIDNNKDGATVTMENVDFNRCAARTSNGGALYTKAQSLSITGDANNFTDCTGYGSGGAVYQLRNADKSSVTLENCTFTGCEANNNGNGGGLYATAKTLTINYDTANDSAIEGAKGSFVNCTAANAGGGLYHDNAGTVNIANCGFDGCTAKTNTGGGLHTTAHTLKIIGVDSKFKNCTAQTDGGGLYQNRNADGSSFTFRDGSFESCTATGNYGGAIYTPAKNVTLQSCTVKGSTAKAQGGGIWISPATKATFDGCTITGNTVTNSDSKGGGVYVNGGTTTYNSGTVSGCGAAYGGGWYQNNGTLYILGGSISGSATNGGGLYMYDGNTKVYHYGGTVAGTATANGGGVYKNNGSYTVGNGSYNNKEYNKGASIGGLITLPVTVNGEETTEAVTSSAVNGGGVYNANGTLTLNAGGSIGSLETGENGGIVYTATATGNGGGIYLGGGAVRIYGGVITNCQATGNGGGIFHTSTGSNNDLYFYGADSTVKIQNCLASNGGGVYVNSNTFHMGENGKTSLGTIENCQATINGGGVYVAGGTFNLRNASAIKACIANADGGGVYQAGGTFNQYNTSSIADCRASNNGGGVYHAGGAFAFSGGDIIRNSAANNGGGVYHAGGTFSMTNASAVIGGSEENANAANMGAGVFVADNQAATFNGSTVTYNHAVNAGGGIAVGGPDAVLTFQGTVTVRHNTMGSQNTACNVYLDQNRNTVIKNNALNAAAYIGVYASDEQDAGHGQSGKPFGTWNTGTNYDKNLNVYHNDRRQYLYGMKGSSNNLVIWPEFVCKITDGDGNLLYKDTSGTPAVYSELETGTNALNTATPTFYTAEGTSYTSNRYQVQMLVQEYELGSGKQIVLSAGALEVTLTTASTEEDECGFKYTGDSRFSATIKRTAATVPMVNLGNNNKLILNDVTLDGGHQAANNAEGAILRIWATAGTTPEVILNSGATLQNGSTANKAGGAVYLKDAACVFTMNAGSQIKDCSAGTSNGGAVAVNNGTFTMNAGSSITGCSAANGGGVYVTNSGAINMNGGTITGNNATSIGGGIALVNGNSRANFSGYCTVTGNTLNGTTRCNVQFTPDTNAIINAKGLDSRSEIGVYTANGTILTKHGESGDPFGTWSEDGDKLFCFVNDRSRDLWNIDLRGFESAVASNHYIYWEYHPLLTVFKAVESDWSYDRNEAEFTFEVSLPEKTSMTQTERNSIKGMSFNGQGIATVKLKAGESASAEFPNNFDKFEYEVKEILSADAQADYETAAQKNGEAYAFAEDKPLTVSGQLGENIGTANSTSLSSVTFTNTRNTDALTIKAETVSTVQSDYEESFDYTLTLGDNTISKTYPATGKIGELEFTAGVASFSLKHNESITIRDLPTDLPYTVEETLNDKQKTHIRTQVSRNGVEPVYAQSQNGKIGEAETPEEVVFTNNFLEIVCKITNRSRALLYYRDTAGKLQPAIFAHLEDAFDQVNSGNLRTSGNGTVSGQLRIEMVVPEYTMERGATLIAGKNVLLSTALTTDEQYPYNEGVDDGEGNVSTVTRGYDGDSMIVTDGAFTIDKITLDGGADVHNATVKGGVVRVTSPVRLTVNGGATLQNSATSGNGGAIWLGAGASLAMNGAILNCEAAAGGGVYAEIGFTGFTATGTISGCEATNGNGGAIYASIGSSVNLNAGTVLTGNTASGDGGAVWSAANVILRGTVGGTEENDGNKAGGNGGGICMGEYTTFTMYAGSSLSGNNANNGGGLATVSNARIAGGVLQNNSATVNGGAVYGGTGSTVAISGAASFTQNEANQGGAVYDGGSATMTGGSMTDNTASDKGGAVYVAGGKAFTMSGGSIKDGNKSPEGAVSTDSDVVLAFSGNAVVRGNTDTDGINAMNVFLGFDSNSIITTTGLGTSADIGVYVADGDPEDPETVEDAVVNPIYSDHGMSSRNFGTYTGSNAGGARLNKFVNDRDTTLNGMAGASVTNGNYVVWTGKGLQLRVYKVDSDGKNPTPASGIRFALTNDTTNMMVWSGNSDATGLVTIPWGAEESENGKAATFAPKSRYTLKQVAANADTVLPAGSWSLTVGRDNSVTWSQDAVIDTVNQTIAIALPEGTEKGYLGDTFDLFNDSKPTLTYNATGGKLSDNKIERTDTIKFTTQETSHAYTITETNPTWDSHVFRNWATMEKKPESTDGVDLTEEELSDKGYFEYDRLSEITFFRGTEQQENTQGTSKGDMTLYAQWDEVVCKITDRDGKILYVNGSPAVYGTLEAGFEAYNAAGSSTFTYGTGGKATARRIEMLVPTYTLNESVSVARGKTVTLTTAPTTDTDSYAYTGEPGTVCVITRGESCDGTMISNNANLTLMNITLDGGNRQVVCEGGFVNNAQTSAVLTIANGATLCNSLVDGNGGAVNAPAGTRVNVTGGTIVGNSASGFGGAIYTAGTLKVSGSARIGDEGKPNRATNGGGIYVADGQTEVTGSAKIRYNTADKQGEARWDEENGGGICLAGGTLNLAGNAEISHNEAKGRGGALYMLVGSATISGNSSLSDNIARNSEGGGGVYVYQSTLNMTGGTITGNRVLNDDGQGGGVRLANGGATFNLSGGTITNNEAASGGGVGMFNDSTMTMTGGTISGNRATNGGGVYSDNSATLNLKDGNIAGNIAETNGGGVYQAGGTFNMTGGTIGGTTASAANKAIDGAGIYVASGSAAVSDGSVTGNQATRDGGGVYNAAGVFALSENGKITGNTATRNGGGVYQNSTGIEATETDPAVPGFTVSGGGIDNNTAAANGGGVYHAGGTFAMTDGTIGGTANKAIDGAGIYVASGSADLSGGGIANNTANGNGGAVFVYNGGILNMSAGGIANNTANGNGGAVFVDNGGILNLSAGSITGNKATGTNGGAINVDGADARLNFSGNPVVYGNPAANGQQKNVVLSVDNNEVINTNETGLTGGTIGVYVIDGTDTYDKHGIQDTPFGTFGDAGHANPQVFVNDRDLALYAVSKSATDTNIYWVPIVCKLTDGSNNLLYTQRNINGQDVKVAAVYPHLEGTDASTCGLAAAEGTLYPYGSTTAYTGNAIQVKMLCDYELPASASVTGTRAVTLTTAETTTDGNTYMASNADSYIFVPGKEGENGRQATDSPSTAIIRRGPAFNDASMFTKAGSAEFTVKDIVLDSGNVQTAVNGGIVNVNAGKLTIADGAMLRNSETTGNGGTVYVAAGAITEMTGGEITGNTAANGGAVYVANGGTMTLKDGTSGTGTSATITGNTATADGAGIYLDEGATLNLEGSPDFGGADVDADGNILGERGNFIESADQAASDGDSTPDSGTSDGGDNTSSATGDGTDDEVAAARTNGQKTYTKERQDIYVKGYLGTVGSGETAKPKPATSIVVTGAINSGAGTIWVAAEEQEKEPENNHYKMLKQFAVYSGSTVNETTMKAFRNAWDDESTGCGADYLTGQDGDDLTDEAGKTWKCIYWTGGFDFVFKKIGPDGNALSGAEFELYTSTKVSEGVYTPATDTSGAFVPYEQTGSSGKKETATTKPIETAADAATIMVMPDGSTIPKKVENVYGQGLLKFEKIPPAVYFIKEKTDADGTVTIGSVKYRPVEDMYMVDLNPKGYYTITRVEVGEDSSKKPTYTNTGAAPTETLTFGTDSVPVALALNVDARTRKVILKKVDGSLTPLEGKYFTVKYADKTTIVKVDGVPLKKLASGVGGAFWIGKLPFGTYYMEEYESNAENAAVAKYFKFKVDDKGVSKPEGTDWTLTNRLDQSTTPLP